MQTTLDPRSIRAVRRQMTLVLLAFSLASVFIGCLILGGSGQPWVRAIGWQFLIWGLVDLIFAWLGVRQFRRADRGEADDVAEATQLARTLRISDKTNWFWMLIGLPLIGMGAVGNVVVLAHGVGVLIQGGFLLIYDRVFMHRLKRLGAVARGH